MATTRALAIFWQTANESPAFLAGRLGLMQLLQDGGPLRMHMAPDINKGNSAHWPLIYLMGSTVAPFRVTLRSQQAFLVLYIGRFAHMWMQPPGSGKLNFNALFSGSGGAGKSFVFNLIMHLTMPGVVQVMSRMTNQVLADGPCILTFATGLWLGHLVCLDHLAAGRGAAGAPH